MLSSLLMSCRAWLKLSRWFPLSKWEIKYLPPNIHSLPRRTTRWAQLQKKTNSGCEDICCQGYRKFRRIPNTLLRHGKRWSIPIYVYFSSEILGLSVFPLFLSLSLPVPLIPNGDCFLVVVVVVVGCDDGGGAWRGYVCSRECQKRTEKQKKNTETRLVMRAGPELWKKGRG